MSRTRLSPRQKSRRLTAWKPHTPTVPRCDWCGVQGCRAECTGEVTAAIQAELDFEEYGMSREDYMREQQEFIAQMQLDEWEERRAVNIPFVDDYL